MIEDTVTVVADAKNEVEQQHQVANTQPNHNASVDQSNCLSPATALSCEMCSNYEHKLQEMQDTARKMQQELTNARAESDRYHQVVDVEKNYRHEMELKMDDVSRTTQQRITTVVANAHALEQRIEAAIVEYTDRLQRERDEYDRLRTNAEMVESRMCTLTAKYENLLGLREKTANEMQVENIELPQTVDQLQFECLQLREKLIGERAAKEHTVSAMQDEIDLLKEEMMNERQNATTREEQLTDEINRLRTEVGVTQSKVTSLSESEARVEQLDKRLAEYQTTIDDLETRLGTLQRERGELEFSVKEYKKRCTTLQQELDTSEAVQRDFVKLSQSLQIELEKIRQAEQEVRWQFEDDVCQCNACKQLFTRSRPRHHCRHCGKIFCEACLSKAVPCGPHMRPAKVCDVCHTLLVRDTAPYFAQSVPHSS